MKIKDYKPANETEALGWLLEECLEVGIEIGRCLRFGIENVHEGRANREYVLTEVFDLQKAINAILEIWIIDSGTQD